MKAVLTDITTPERAEEIAAYRAERTAHYVAKFGRDCELAHLNAEWDTHGKFRNVAYGKAIMALFNAARNGGPDFILRG